MIDIKEFLLQWAKNLLTNRTSEGTVKNKIISRISSRTKQTNYWKILKKKVKSPFIDNIWGADLADMQLISKFNKGIHFLSCVINIFGKCEWVIP